MPYNSPILNPNRTSAYAIYAQQSSKKYAEIKGEQTSTQKDQEEPECSTSFAEKPTLRRRKLSNKEETIVKTPKQIVKNIKKNTKKVMDVEIEKSIENGMDGEREEVIPSDEDSDISETKLPAVSIRTIYPENKILKEPERNVSLSRKSMSKKQKMNKRKEITDGTPKQAVKKRKGKNQVFRVEKDEEESSSENDEGGPKFAPTTIPCGNKAAVMAVGWILNPVTPADFFEKYFDQQPLHISRSNINFYKGLFCSDTFNKIVKENHLLYGDHIDVLIYKNKMRQPIDLITEKVTSSFVWNAFKDGYSVRFRNPQVYHESLQNLCSLVQEYFSSNVGVNMYLTPAGYQGFPPHFDDIDAFVLQIEGKKIWKLYNSLDENEVLARKSKDLKEDEIGEPFMEVELKAGDMLYFPRGVIHQAKSAPDVHSLHLTVSTNQLNTWGDLLLDGFIDAVEQATENDVEFRKTVPKDIFDYAGSLSVSANSPEREEFLKKTSSLMHKALDYFSVEHIVDSAALNFMHKSLPPGKKECSVHGNGAEFKNGKVHLKQNLTLNNKIRFIRKRAVRVLLEFDMCRLFYTMENKKDRVEGDEAASCELDSGLLPAISVLLNTCPAFVKIKDLPHEDSDALLTLMQKLYDLGILMTKKAIKCSSE
ncbi:ribosomal oxygenase 1 [Caerostris extrusa]|uniref:Bifunctional lysine-specific demethylase and histidyl-hydroxylase n=1 Tax=Caerostris extrusa TaxID=172846 RepID=A0AAV4TSD4_CAEEX|nr:ribosomal oxygenase 1 [Caerostris extrusa]